MICYRIYFCNFTEEAEVVKWCTVIRWSVGICFWCHQFSKASPNTEGAGHEKKILWHTYTDLLCLLFITLSHSTKLPDKFPIIQALYSNRSRYFYSLVYCVQFTSGSHLFVLDIIWGNTDFERLFKRQVNVHYISASIREMIGLTQGRISV